PRRRRNRCGRLAFRRPSWLGGKSRPTRHGPESQPDSAIPDASQAARSGAIFLRSPSCPLIECAPAPQDETRLAQSLETAASVRQDAQPRTHPVSGPRVQAEEVLSIPFLTRQRHTTFIRGRTARAFDYRLAGATRT